MERPSLKRIPVIDIFRGISILITLAIHLGPVYITLPYHVHFIDYIWFKLWSAGGYGVSMFFFISGYLITRLIAENPNGLFRPDFRDFYVRRAGRILPLLSLIGLLGILLARVIPVGKAWSLQALYCLHNPTAPFTPVLALSIALFAFNWYKTWLGGSHPFFGLHWDVLWSLSIEEQFYFFYPLLLRKLGSVRKLSIFCIFLVLLGPAVRWTGMVTYRRWETWNSFGHFGMMAFGVLLFIAQEYFQARLSANKKACWWLCAAGLYLMCFYAFHSSAKIYFWTAVVSETMVGLGLFLFLLGGLHLECFKSPLWLPLTWPGQLSYGMYLFHASLLYFLWPLLGKMTHFSAWLIFCLATAILAQVSYRFYELPLNRLIRSSLGSTRPSPMRAVPAPPSGAID